MEEHNPGQIGLNESRSAETAYQQPVPEEHTQINSQQMSQANPGAPAAMQQTEQNNLPQDTYINPVPPQSALTGQATLSQNSGTPPARQNRSNMHRSRRPSHRKRLTRKPCSIPLLNPKPSINSNPMHSRTLHFLGKCTIKTRFNSQFTPSWTRPRDNFTIATRRLSCSNSPPFPKKTLMFSNLLRKQLLHQNNPSKPPRRIMVR